MSRLFSSTKKFETRFTVETLMVFALRFHSKRPAFSSAATAGVNSSNSWWIRTNRGTSLCKMEKAAESYSDWSQNTPVTSGCCDIQCRASLKSPQEDVVLYFHLRNLWLSPDGKRAMVSESTNTAVPHNKTIVLVLFHRSSCRRMALPVTPAKIWNITMTLCMNRSSWWKFMVYTRKSVDVKKVKRLDRFDGRHSAPLRTKRHAEIANVWTITVHFEMDNISK